MSVAAAVAVVVVAKEAAEAAAVFLCVRAQAMPHVTDAISVNQHAGVRTTWSGSTVTHVLYMNSESQCRGTLSAVQCSVVQ